jgi:hypothetical protein
VEVTGMKKEASFKSPNKAKLLTIVEATGEEDKKNCGCEDVKQD